MCLRRHEGAVRLHQARHKRSLGMRQKIARTINIYWHVFPREGAIHLYGGLLLTHSSTGRGTIDRSSPTSRGPHLMATVTVEMHRQTLVM